MAGRVVERERKGRPRRRKGKRQRHLQQQQQQLPARPTPPSAAASSRWRPPRGPPRRSRPWTANTWRCCGGRREEAQKERERREGVARRSRPLPSRRLWPCSSPTGLCHLLFLPFLLLYLVPRELLREPASRSTASASRTPSRGCRGSSRPRRGLKKRRPRRQRGCAERGRPWTRGAGPSEGACLLLLLLRRLRGGLLFEAAEEEVVRRGGGNKERREKRVQKKNSKKFSALWLTSSLSFGFEFPSPHRAIAPALREVSRLQVS